MDYIKTNWIDGVYQYPSRFALVDNGDGTVSLTRVTGTVTQSETIVTAAEMNNIEIALNYSVNSSKYNNVSGTSTNIICTINEELTDGYILRFISKYDNNGNLTKMNNIPIYKINTTVSPIIKNRENVTLCYNKSNACFYYQYTSEGYVTESKVLIGNKFSNFYNMNLIGTMPNNGTLNYTIPTVNGIYNIPYGYNNGGRIYMDNLTNLTSNATITNANQIKEGYKCYSDGVLYTGTRTLRDNALAGRITVDSSGNAYINGLSSQPVYAFFHLYDGSTSYGSDGYNCIYSQVYDVTHQLISNIKGSSTNNNVYTHYSKEKQGGYSGQYGIHYHYYDERITYDNGTMTLTGYVTPNAVGKHINYIMFFNS